MRSSISIDIDAPPDLVFALARDVTRWSDLLPHYVRSSAVRDEADGRVLVLFVARRPVRWLPGLGLLVTWRASTWAERDPWRLRFVHRGGATNGMDVTWQIEPLPRGEGCRVTIVHDFPAPRPWAAFIDRFFTHPIATRTLATFRTIAEAVNTSKHASATNQPT